MTREEAISVLEMFEFKQCDLGRMKHTKYTENDVWEAMLMAIEALQAQPTHGRLIDADFEEQHYASMLLNPTPDVTAKDKEDARIILGALKMAKTVSVDEQIQSMVEKRVAELVHLNHELEQQLADRPHGEWKVNTDDSCGGITLTCSDCGEQFNFDDADEVLDFKEHAHFCINCGAKMGGDKECL